MWRVIKAVLAILGALLLIAFVVELGSEGKPPVYYAIRRGDTNALQRYISSGGDVNRRIPFPKGAPTLLAIAASSGRIDAVDMLLKNKADPNFYCDGFDWSLLARVVDAHESRGSNDPYLEIMKLLLAHGANPNLTNQWGHHCPALYDAAEFGDAEMIKLLLAAGADVNATNNIGQIPLHIAKNVESARLLIAAGANLKALSYGETPADVALRNHRLEVHELLTNQSARLP